jgi:Uma2 family endonuclease
MPSAIPLDPPRKHWTREECDALEAVGLLDGAHLELVEGELISKMGKKRPHTITLTLVGTLLIRVFGEEFVNWHAPIDVAPEDNPTNEPEPDIIVLQRPHWEYPTSNPLPSDLRLLIEVSDTTLGFDLTRKAALYARAGIADYWVFDVAARRLIVHRDPRDGRYQSVMEYGEHESVAALAAPDAPLKVGDAFFSTLLAPPGFVGSPREQGFLRFQLLHASRS